MTLKKIQQFAQTLDRYANDLACSMRPLDPEKAPGILVPIYVKESQGEIIFAGKVSDYRQQLTAIYEEIVRHMFWIEKPILSNRVEP